MFIAHQTGSRYDTVQTWLLFIVFPGLILALLSVIILSQLAVTTFADQEPKGMLIFQEPNTSFVEAVEYRSFRKENAFSCSLLPLIGPARHLKTAGVIAELPYPLYTFDETFPDMAKASLDKVRGLEEQLPGARRQLEMVRGKWERALSVYQQTHKPNPSVARKEASLPVLTLPNARYS
jgi:hypothetical protein